MENISSESIWSVDNTSACTLAPEIAAWLIGIKYLDFFKTGRDLNQRSGSVNILNSLLRIYNFLSQRLCIYIVRILPIVWIVQTVILGSK